MERKLSYVITNKEQFKNPVLCYLSIMQWMQEQGEDFIDYNERLVDGDEILDWLLEKKYITEEKYGSIKEDNETWIQDLLLGYESGVMKNGECSFTATKKSYQLIAEFISDREECRNELFEKTCTDAEYNCVYYDGEGKNILSACVYECDLLTGTMSKEEWLNQGWNADISFTDEYNYLYNMTIEEADIEDED